MSSDEEIVSEGEEDEEESDSGSVYRPSESRVNDNDGSPPRKSIKGIKSDGRKYKNKIFVGIILWLGWTFNSLNNFLVLFHYLPFSGFWCNQCWFTKVGSSNRPSVFSVMCLGSVILKL